jgi:hypothetical protein
MLPDLAASAQLLADLTALSETQVWFSTVLLQKSK